MSGERTLLLGMCLAAGSGCGLATEPSSSTAVAAQTERPRSTGSLTSGGEATLVEATSSKQDSPRREASVRVELTPVTAETLASDQRACPDDVVHQWLGYPPTLTVNAPIGIVDWTMSEELELLPHVVSYVRGADGVEWARGQRDGVSQFGDRQLTLALFSRVIANGYITVHGLLVSLGLGNTHVPQTGALMASDVTVHSVCANSGGTVASCEERVKCVRTIRTHGLVESIL
jgi:hypothetical protein